jgi:V8-like Glu-specific endopeptidase
VGGGRVHYLTDTLKGSSGSPVFNSNWEVVALHHRGGWLAEPGSKRMVYRNQGIAIGVVLRGLRAAGLLLKA